MLTINVHDTPIPALGFGTWELRGDACEKAVAIALDAGYRHLDTAQIYENEHEVGTALRASGLDRGDVFLTTKVWRTNLQPDTLLSSVDESLERLHTDHVDLLLIHWPNRDVELTATLDALQSVRAQGKTRLIGVSNFTPSLLARALDLAPDLACNQVEYHPFLSQDTLLELVRKHDMALTAYSPLGQGIVPHDETLQTIAATHGKSAVQVAIRWLLQQERVAAIPRSSSEQHIRANADVFDFSLDENEMDTVSALARGQRIVDPSFAPAWES